MTKQPTIESLSDVLILLSPPIRKVVWLEKLYASKEAKGEHVPQEFKDWLERWRKIRGWEPGTPIDMLIEEERRVITEHVKATLCNQ